MGAGGWGGGGDPNSTVAPLLKKNPYIDNAGGGGGIHFQLILEFYNSHVVHCASRHDTCKANLWCVCVLWGSAITYKSPLCNDLWYPYIKRM